jgi:plastocyanin
MRSSRRLRFAFPIGAGVALVAAVPSPRASAGAPAVVTGSVDRSLAKTLSDAVVYVEDVPGKTFQPPRAPAIIEQRHMAFEPHVLPVLKGTTVRFPNADRVRHNVFSPSPAKPFNLGIYYPQEARDVVFEKVGVITLLCNVHEQMSGYLLVLQNPYFSRVTSDGHFTIADVPDGNHSLVLWREGKPLVKLPLVVRGANVTINFGPTG